MRTKSKNRAKERRVESSRGRSLKKYTFAVTGHNMDRLGGFGPEQYAALQSFCFGRLQLEKPDRLIVGMTLGTDLTFAAAAAKLSIPFIAAVPYKGWTSNWTDAQQVFADRLLRSAAKVVYVSDPPHKVHKITLRNRWMVDNADAIYSLWDGKTWDDTYATKSYAESKNKTVIDLWYQWEDYLKEFKS